MKSWRLSCLVRGLAVGLLLWGLLPAALAPATDQPHELLVGIEPEHNIFDQMERYRHLADYLAGQLQIKVRFTIMSRYGEGIKRFKARKLDGAFLTPYPTNKALQELDLEPLVHPVGLDGDLTSQGYIFVRQDSAIRGADDMYGKSIVFVDPATMEGYLFPLAYLLRHGMDDLSRDFSRFYFAGSHASAILAVLDGRADIGAAKSTVFNRLADEDNSIRQELFILGRSPAVPEITLCLRKELDATLRSRLTTILLTMDQNSQGQMALKRFKALRFVKAMAAEFSKVAALEEEVRPLLKEAGKRE
ncbi:MAG: phosphate/phosphite/phosphonate ABC transporter substrate-binding protein [Desulfurivibrionaceae bacterium]|nr:phosphate/phosphite/phosphonate ABC transporter substrate-binding protein [Desulfurivibrionaceae bacterium]